MPGHGAEAGGGEAVAAVGEGGEGVWIFQVNVTGITKRAMHRRSAACLAAAGVRLEQVHEGRGRDDIILIAPSTGRSDYVLSLLLY
jgi:hypothetical protein